MHSGVYKHDCAAHEEAELDGTRRYAELREQRKGAKPAAKPAAAAAAGEAPCAKARAAMQQCMVEIYVESVCSKPLHELAECARQHRPGAGAGDGASPPGACKELEGRFEACTPAAMEGHNADAAFRRFVEEGRTWKSPTKGRMSMMHVPGHAPETTPMSASAGRS